MNQNDPPLMPLGISIEGAARLLGIGKTKVYELLSTGELESYLIGRRRLVTAESVHSILMARPHQVKARACLRVQVANPKEVTFLRRMLTTKYPSDAQIAWIDKIFDRI